MGRSSPTYANASTPLKFAQLPLNARFTFRSRTFRKVSPIEALDEGSEARKLIPRSAQVAVLSVEERPGASAQPQPLTSDEVEAALSACLAQLRGKARALHPPLDGEQLAAVDTLLQSAGDDVIVRLGLENRNNFKPSEVQNDRTSSSDKEH